MSAWPLSTARGRWYGVGPYYAMFPRDFTIGVIETHTLCGDAVLDPFAGRGSSIYAAAALGRPALGVEINPVGWVYSRAKLDPAPLQAVLARLEEISECATEEHTLLAQDDTVFDFFRLCYTAPVLAFLLAARSMLDWRHSGVDATLMALLLVYLHGKKAQSLSNQMRQGKAMSPPYCVRWWTRNASEPPERDPLAFMSKRIGWRYAKGIPHMASAHVWLGDAREELLKPPTEHAGFGLLFTSPPYAGVTNYHYDQWLRLWVLGGSPYPAPQDHACQGRFYDAGAYRALLRDVFARSADLMRRRSTVYVRTDARDFTLQTTLDALREAFPKHALTVVTRPYHKHTQTALFGDKSEKPGECDILMRR